MKRLILSLVAMLFATQVWASGGDQLVKVNSIANGVAMPVTDNGGTLTVDGAITVDSTNLDIRDLTSGSDSISAVQSGTWNINTVTSITNVVHVDDNASSLTVDATDLDVRDLTSTSDSISAVQSGNWVIQSITNAVTVQATNLDIRDLGYAADSVKIYGSEGVPVKTDATGQIYAVTSAASVDAIEKTYTFSNIATGSWIEIGSYTVTTAKALKIDGVKFTSGYDTEFKVSDGLTGDEIYGQSAPANPNDAISITHPGAKSAGIVITVYAKTTESVNAGTIRVMGFEYTP